MNNKIKALLALVVFTLISGFVGYNQMQPKLAGATPSQILESKLATATSTVTHMTVGAATTTMSFDTQTDGGFSADSAVLMVQLTSSSTAQLLAEVQYSQDNIDWYQSDLSERGTTTASLSIGAQQFLTFNWATSTLNKAADRAVPGTAATSTAFRVVSVDTPTRYVRVLFTLTPGAGYVYADLWAEFVAKKQLR